MSKFNVGDSVMFGKEEAVIVEVLGVIHGSEEDMSYNICHKNKWYCWVNEGEIIHTPKKGYPVAAENATVHTSLSPLGIEAEEMDFEMQKMICDAIPESRINTAIYVLLQFIEWLKLEVNSAKSDHAVVRKDCGDAQKSMVAARKENAELKERIKYLEENNERLSKINPIEDCPQDLRIAKYNQLLPIIDRIIQASHSHVDKRFLFLPLRNRHIMDIVKRVDANEYIFAGDWLEELGHAIEALVDCRHKMPPVVKDVMRYDTPPAAELTNSTDECKQQLESDRQ